MFFHQLLENSQYFSKYYLNFSSLPFSCLLLFHVVFSSAPSVSSLWGTCIKSMLSERYSMFIMERFNIVKMSILSKLMYRFNAISVKTPRLFCCCCCVECACVLNDSGFTGDQMGFPGGTVVKTLSTCQCRRRWFDPLIWKIPWRMKWNPIPIFLPGKSHGQRRLVGYSPWDRRVRHDWTTEHTPRG